MCTRRRCLEVPKDLHYEEGYGWEDGCKDDCIDVIRKLCKWMAVLPVTLQLELYTEIKASSRNEVSRKDSARLSISPSRSS